MDIEKAIKKAWDKVEAKIGQPLGVGDRKKLTELAGGEPVIAEFVESYILALDNLLKGHDVFKRVERRGPEGDSTMAKGGMGIKATQIAAKRFQRRADIAEFVLFAIYTPPELFIPLVRKEPLPKKRVNWKKMVTEWNQAHPSDTMTSTHVFRTTFYRILREAEVLQEILSREFAGEENLLKILRSCSKDFIKYIPKDRNKKEANHNERTHSSKR